MLGPKDEGLDVDASRLASDFDSESKYQNSLLLDSYPTDPSQHTAYAENQDGKNSSVSQQKPLPPPSSSSFLPSLSMNNYYYSGSESESEDPRSRDGEILRHPEKKNRRGQRARQQIAELKYGEKAKHLQTLKDEQKQSQKERGRKNGGWDPRKGAVEEYAASRNSASNGKREVAGAHKLHKGLRSSGVRRAKPEAEDAAEEKIHPSWEAARRKKMEMKSQSFAGKKIVFD